MVKLHRCTFRRKMIFCNSNSIKKSFDSERIYNKKFLKTKSLTVMKLLIFSINKRLGWVEVTDFQDKEMPRVCSNYISLAVILIDFVLKEDEIY